MLNFIESKIALSCLVFTKLQHREIKRSSDKKKVQP